MSFPYRRFLGAMVLASLVSLVALSHEHAWGAPHHPGDIDSDGDVDFNDVGHWELNFPTGSTLGQGDAEGDGDVDVHDLKIILNNYPFIEGQVLPTVQLLLTANTETGQFTLAAQTSDADGIVDLWVLLENVNSVSFDGSLTSSVQSLSPYSYLRGSASSIADLGVGGYDVFATGTFTGPTLPTFAALGATTREGGIGTSAASSGSVVAVPELDSSLLSMIGALGATAMLRWRSKCGCTR
jgi:hypothetical protein